MKDEKFKNSLLAIVGIVAVVGLTSLLLNSRGGVRSYGAAIGGSNDCNSDPSLCSAEQYCDSGGECQPGCADATACSTFAGYGTWECTADHDCEADTACADGSACNFEGGIDQCNYGICEERCGPDSDECEFRVVQCDSSGNGCGPSQFCDSPFCVDCLSDGDCPSSDPICEGGACGFSCEYDPSLCDSFLSTDPECNTGDPLIECSAGCEDGSCYIEVRYLECVTDSDCTDEGNWYCDGDVCVVDPSCGAGCSAWNFLGGSYECCDSSSDIEGCESGGGICEAVEEIEEIEEPEVEEPEGVEGMPEGVGGVVAGSSAGAVGGGRKMRITFGSILSYFESTGRVAYSPVRRITKGRWFPPSYTGTDIGWDLVTAVLTPATMGSWGAFVDIPHHVITEAAETMASSEDDCKKECNPNTFNDPDPNKRYPIASQVVENAPDCPSDFNSIGPLPSSPYVCCCGDLCKHHKECDQCGDEPACNAAGPGCTWDGTQCKDALPPDTDTGGDADDAADDAPTPPEMTWDCPHDGCDTSAEGDATTVNAAMNAHYAAHPDHKP